MRAEWTFFGRFRGLKWSVWHDCLPNVQSGPFLERAAPDSNAIPPLSGSCIGRLHGVAGSQTCLPTDFLSRPRVSLPCEFRFRLRAPSARCPSLALAFSACRPSPALPTCTSAPLCLRRPASPARRLARTPRLRSSYSPMRHLPFGTTKGLLGLGGGLPGGGHAALTPASTDEPLKPFQPGGPAPRRVAGARPRFLYGQPEGRARQERLDGFRTGAPDGESKCGGRGDISRVSRAAPKARGLLACQASVD